MIPVPIIRSPARSGVYTRLSINGTEGVPCEQAITLRQRVDRRRPARIFSRGMRIVPGRGPHLAPSDAPSHHRTVALFSAWPAICRRHRVHKTASLFTVAAGALLACAAAAAQHESPAAPSIVKDVMITMTIPASDVIFDAASEVPKGEAQWAALKQAAATLAESGRLLMAAPLAKDDTAWREMAGDLVIQAEATRKLAEAKKGAALEDAGDKIYGTCEACHARYMAPGN
jgi:hypothetical protein